MPLPGLVSPPGYFFTPAPAGPPLITTNLKVQFEMDNSIAPTNTSWVDEIAGINLIVQPSMVAPSIQAGGTPTGQDYYQFTTNEGLGTILLAGEDLPIGGASRSLYVLCRYPSSPPFGEFNGVVYGTPDVGDSSFGILSPASVNVFDIDFFVTLHRSTLVVRDDTFHVILAIYDEPGTPVPYLDNVSSSTSKPFGGSDTTNTILKSFYINELLSDDAGGFIDVAAILLYAGAHDAADRLSTFNYLNDKYIGA